MKVCIVTVIDNVNIGTYLQAYALAKVIERRGHRAEYLDYSRPSRDNYQMFFRSFSRIKPFRWPGYWLWLIKRAAIIRRHRLFIDHYLSQRHYVGYSDVLKNPPQADIYLTGSDQVWNSFYNEGIDETFYLGFTPTDAIRVSYASSIGMNNIPEIEKKEMYKLLCKYKAISVRESSAVKQLQDLGFDVSKISLVLDPTLLLKENDWKDVARAVKEDSPYLLVYSVENDMSDTLNAVAGYIANMKRLRIVLLSHGDKSGIKCSKHYKNADPPTFLSLFLHASYTVVSSFHGTAFSINFRKDFVTVMPNQFGSRVNSILQLCGLESRKFICGESELSSYLSPVEYEKADIILDKMRDISYEFLHKWL